MKFYGFILLFLVLGCASKPHKHLNFSDWNRTADCCAVSGKQIAISSGGTFSSKAGMEIYDAGGNIVDVAVATAFALAVERPHSLGLGGGGFLLLSLVAPKNTVSFVDFRETAPGKATPKMYQDKDGKVDTDKSRKGILSVGTPGFVPGLYQIHQRWGKLPWHQVLGPSIRLARNGFPIYLSLAQAFEEEKDVLTQQKYLRNTFYPNQKAPQKGEILQQLDLARTLERISKNPVTELTTGETAKRLIQFMKQQGGILTLHDLKQYRPEFRAPIQTIFQGKTLLLAPPPSAGGLLIGEMGLMLKSDPLNELGETPYLHLLAETLRRAYADRSRFVGDPDFTKIPVKQLLNENYTRQLRKSISLEKATDSQQVKPGQSIKDKDTHTSHLSVIDASGNGVSMTLTINDHFGSRMAVPETGIFLNDEMDDFSSKPGEPNLFGLVGTQANQILPYKRPASSMSPTLVLDGQKVVLSLGAAGGSRITSSVFQVLSQVLTRRSPSLKSAVFNPRIHHQWLPDQLLYENGFSKETLSNLSALGHNLSETKRTAIIQAVQRNPDGNLEAVFDPRDEGGVEAK